MLLFAVLQAERMKRIQEAAEAEAGWFVHSSACMLGALHAFLVLLFCICVRFIML